MPSNNSTDPDFVTSVLDRVGVKNVGAGGKAGIFFGLLVIIYLLYKYIAVTFCVSPGVVQAGDERTSSHVSPDGNSSAISVKEGRRGSSSPTSSPSASSIRPAQRASPPLQRAAVSSTQLL